MILELDLETTALDEVDGGIIEIGARWFRDYEGLPITGHVRKGEFFRECRPREGCLIEDKALEVNGQTAAIIFDDARMPEAQAIVELLGFIRAGIANEDIKVEIAAWNAHFEMRHLRRALRRAGVAERYWGIRHSVIDPHSILLADLIRGRFSASPLIHPTPPHYSSYGKLVTNCDHASQLLGIEPEQKPHNALKGARQVHKFLVALGFPESDPVEPKERAI